MQRRRENLTLHGLGLLDGARKPADHGPNRRRVSARRRQPQPLWQEPRALESGRAGTRRLSARDREQAMMQGEPLRGT
jgi:hypothetical protein